MANDTKCLMCRFPEEAAIHNTAKQYFTNTHEFQICTTPTQQEKIAATAWANFYNEGMYTSNEQKTFLSAFKVGWNAHAEQSVGPPEDSYLKGYEID